MATLTLSKVIKASGGEGSRGGKVIGHTRSGEAIYSGRAAQHPAHLNFHAEDHDDAAYLHAKAGAHEQAYQHFHEAYKARYGGDKERGFDPAKRGPSQYERLVERHHELSEYVKNQK